MLKKSLLILIGWVFIVTFSSPRVLRAEKGPAGKGNNYPRQSTVSENRAFPSQNTSSATAPSPITSPSKAYSGKATQPEGKKKTEVRQGEEETTSVKVVRPRGYSNTIITGFPKERKGDYLSANLYGTSGLIRLSDTRIPPLYSFRLGLNMGFYYMEKFIEDRTHTHLETRGFFSYTPWDYIEVYLRGFASAHKIGEDPYGIKPAELLQVLGDTTIGVKGAYNIQPYTFMSVGGRLELTFPTRLGNFGSTLRATSMEIDALFEMNFQKWEKTRIPLYGVLNLGYLIDNSWALTRNIRPLYWSRVIGYHITEGDQIKFGLGVEYPHDFYSLIFEYTTEQVFAHRSFLQSPMRITLGGKLNPWDYLTLTMGLDLDFFQKGYVPPKATGDLNKEEVAPNYQILFGMDYIYSPTQGGVIDIRGQIKGVVIDVDTGMPVGGAIVEYVNQPQLSKQVVDLTTGEFKSYKLMPGEVIIKIEKKGYVPKIIKAKIISNKVITEKILLSKISRAKVAMGAIAGQVVDNKGNPVKATLQFLETNIPPLETTEDGKFEKLLPVGVYKILVKARGYAPRAFKVPVEAMKKVVVKFQLVKGPEIGAFAGKVVSYEGKPLAAVIRFINSNIPEITTNPETGEFSKILPPGEYEIEVAAKGYAPRRFKIPVLAGRKTKVTFKLVKQGRIGAFAGKVLDMNGNPIPGATIQFADPRIPTVKVDPKTGEFFIKLPAGTYDIKISAPGFKAKIYRVPVLKGKKTLQEFHLERLNKQGEKGGEATVKIVKNKIVLPGKVKFKTGTDKITEDSFYFLNLLANFLKKHPEIKKVEIQAYSDNQGPSLLNKKLTQKQAEAVKNYLVKMGIDEKRLIPKGYGEANPIADNSTPEGREKNRRVEFVILK